MNQYTELTHEYKMDGTIVPGVTNIINYFFPIYKRDDIEWYASKGKAVHKACELYDRGVLNPSGINEVIIPFFEQWKLCKEALKIKVLKNETVLFSKKFRFGGTMDKLVIINDKLTLLEIKTTSVINKVTSSYQTIGYTILHNEEVKSKDKIKKRLIVQLKENTYNLFWPDKKSDEHEFLSLLSVYNILKREGK